MFAERISIVSTQLSASLVLIFKRVLAVCIFILANIYVSHAGVADTLLIKKLLEQSKQTQRTDQNQSWQAAQKAYTLSQEAEYKYGMAGALIRIGSILYTNGKLDSSITIIKESYTLYAQMKMAQGAASACLLLGYIYLDKGMKDSAFSALYQALRWNQKANDPIGLAQIYIHLGNLYLDYGNSTLALENFLLAKSISEKNHQSDNLISAWDGLGRYYLASKKYKLGLHYFLKVDSACRKLNDIYTVAQNLTNIGVCYESIGNYIKSKGYYQLALKEYTELEMTDQMALGNYNLANIYLTLDQPDSAIPHLNAAVALGRKSNDLVRVMKSYNLLSAAFAKIGNFSLAFNYHQQYSDLNDSVLNNEKVKQIAEMQTKYDAEKKEQQISLLNAQNNSKLAQQKALIAGIVALILLLLILTFYYIQRQRLVKKNDEISKQKINSLLNEQEIKTYNAMIDGQEEERKRIATDLHDRLGSMLSTVKLLFSAVDTKLYTATEDGKEQYIKANSLLDEACVEVRRISHNLSTGMVVSFGLIAALEELCESIDQSKLIKCKLLSYGLNERLDQQIELGIYRMIQELFNNILKHAKAAQVTVQINRTEESVNITIEDNGVGFNVEERKRSGGLGLANLVQRAAQLNGAYHIDSTPGFGTISIIEIPLAHTQ
jgi:signal transduction histidine kinase